MKTKILRASLIVLALSASALVFGQASMTLTSGGGNIFGDVYIGPYTALINGVSTEVICDDYLNETYLNESWTATETTVGSSATAMFGAANSQQYDEVAWLATQLLSGSSRYCTAATTDCTADIQYAIWDVFDGSASNGVGTSNDQANIAAWLSAAENNTYTTGEFSFVDIYTPTGTPAGYSGPPQEFIVVDPPVSSPEPPALALLGVDFGCIAAAILILARRRKANSEPI